MSTMTFHTAVGGVSAGPTVPPRTSPRPAPASSVAHDDPDVFLKPLLGCLPLSRRALELAVGSALAFDLCAGLAQGLEPGRGGGPDIRAWAAASAAGAGALFALAAAGVLLLIQVRYTFEHAALHREHFYELKLARFREASAQLKSLSVREAVSAVRALQGLRKEVGGLDRRLAIETLMTRRRLRDLVWLSRAAAMLGAGLVLAVMALSGQVGALRLLAVLAGVGLVALIELWARERMSRAIGLLAPAPAELAQAFDPSPPLEAAVERLLTRLNRHFDRLKGPGDRLEEENDPSA